MKVWYQGTQSGALQWIRYYSFKQYLPDCYNEKELKIGIRSDFWEKQIHGNEEEQRNIIKFFLDKIVDGYDLFIFQRVYSLFGLSIIQLLQKHNVKVITELDDYFEFTPKQPAFHTTTQAQVEIIEEQLRMSNAIIVSTDHLKKLYKKYNDNIHILRNCIDNFYAKEMFKTNTNFKITNNKIRILYSASASHDGDIETVYPQLKRITEEFDDVEVILFGGCGNFTKRKDKIHKIPYSNDLHSYYKDLSLLGCDIGIAPLMDTAFNSAKSNFRFIEYSALGIPTLASYSNDFKKDIDRGYCYRADFTVKDDWYKKLGILITKGKDSLHHFGLQAKQYSHNEYCTRKEANKLNDFVVKQL